MSDRENNRPKGAPSWLDLELANPEPKVNDDRKAVEAFIDKLSRAMKSLSQPKNKADDSPTVL